MELQTWPPYKFTESAAQDRWEILQQGEQKLRVMHGNELVPPGFSTHPEQSASYQEGEKLLRAEQNRSHKYLSAQDKKPAGVPFCNHSPRGLCCAQQHRAACLVLGENKETFDMKKQSWDLQPQVYLFSNTDLIHPPTGFLY